VRSSLERRVRIVAEQATEAAEPEHDGVPHRQLALALEALEERQVVGSGQAPSDDLLPGVVDEVVALQ